MNGELNTGINKSLGIGINEANFEQTRSICSANREASGGDDVEPNWRCWDVLARERLEKKYRYEGRNAWKSRGRRGWMRIYQISIKIEFFIFSDSRFMRNVFSTQTLCSLHLPHFVSCYAAIVLLLFSQRLLFATRELSTLNNLFLNFAFLLKVSCALAVYDSLFSRIPLVTCGILWRIHKEVEIGSFEKLNSSVSFVVKSFFVGETHC